MDLLKHDQFHAWENYEFMIMRIEMGIKNWGKNYGQLLKNNKIVKIGEKWMDARLKNAINGEKKTD